MEAAWPGKRLFMALLRAGAAAGLQALQQRGWQGRWHRARRMSASQQISNLLTAGCAIHPHLQKPTIAERRGGAKP